MVIVVIVTVPVVFVIVAVPVVVAVAVAICYLLFVVQPLHCPPSIEPHRLTLKKAHFRDYSALMFQRFYYTIYSRIVSYMDSKGVVHSFCILALHASYAG